MRKWLTVLVLIVGIGLGAPESGLASPLFQSTLGVNHHFPGNDAQDAKDIADTAAAGFRLIRYDMTWELVERSRGVYDFSAFDPLVAQMAAKGIRPLFILDYGNALYGNSRSVRTPEGRAAFARFAAAAAARYKGKNVIWEIWNEPNADFFWSPAANANEYMQLLIDAATAIKLADPSAYVIAPGVNRMDFDFMQKCLKAGLLRHINAVSVHPYRDSHPETALDELARLQNLLAEHEPGLATPFVVGEWGYTTLHPGVTEEFQAIYLQRLFLVNAMAGAEFTIWYDFRNDGTDPRNFEHNFGLYGHDGREKPALAAVRELSRQLAGKRFSRRLFSHPEDFLLEFADSKGKTCVAAWTVRKDHLAAVPGRAAVTLTQKPQFIGCQ